MRIAHYTDEYADNLRLAIEAANAAPLLRCTSYVRHMYQSHPRSRLALLLGDGDEVLATLGMESVPMSVRGERREFALGTNTYSLKPGALGLLLHHWMASDGTGLMLPMNAVWNAMLARQPRWHSVPGLRTWILNWNYPVLPGDPWWKRVAKGPARRLMRIDPETFPRRTAADFPGLVAEETSEISPDMVERRTHFDLKLDPDVDYLRWRYSTRLEHVRHRVHRLRQNGKTCGYVVLAEWPHRLVVMHCDGDDPGQLAHGVLLAVADANRGDHRFRQVFLSSMHPVMSRVFEKYGFRPKPAETPLYMATFGKDTSPLAEGPNWLVSMDLGDHGIALGLLDERSRLRAKPAGT